MSWATLQLIVPATHFKFRPVFNSSPRILIIIHSPRLLLLLLALVVFIFGARANEFSPPSEWSEADGNPMEEGGKPLWRADFVEKGDVHDAANYVPMVWKEKFWMPEDPEQFQGNWPHVEVHPEGPALVAAGGWDARPFRKISAFVFIAPASATYHLRGEAQLRSLQGQGEAKLHILKRSGGNISPVDEIVLDSKEPAPFPDTAVELDEADELVVVAEVSRANNAVKISLVDFAVSDSPSDQ